MSTNITFQPLENISINLGPLKKFSTLSITLVDILKGKRHPDT